MSQSKSSPDAKRVRRNPYVPHLAASRFKPAQDWSFDEAKELYEKSRGDIIHYADCIEGMKELPSESIDCAIADPPFGLSFTGREAIYNRDSRFVTRGYREVSENYSKFSEEWIGQLPRVMKQSASAWIFSGWTNLLDILAAVKKARLKIINHVIWKYQFGVFTERKFVTSHYHLLFVAKSRDYYFNKVMHYPLDVWEINRTYRKGEVKNATKLPDELVCRCLDFTTKPGDLVIDPFMGNGTTAVAARANFRHFIGFETNAAMRAVIESNIASVKVGERYMPYSERHDELVSRARAKFRSHLS